jgi:hypothetical protein
MRGTLHRTTGKSIVAILCAASFLTMTLGSVSPGIAAETWETWPRKTAEPGLEQKPATDASEASNDWETWPKKKAEPGTGQKPAKALAAEEKKPASGRSYGKIAWIALGIAAVIGIGLAAGGGGDEGGVVTNPGHQ